MITSVALTPSAQIKITLPVELQQFAQSKASKFGLSLSTYIKHLVLEDVKDMEVPTFPMSQKTEQTALQALKEHEEKKTHIINNVDEFLDTL
jgi:antitoxin component of RelBE/YafQ-DinJ toxin-antitoxin module